MTTPLIGITTGSRKFNGTGHVAVMPTYPHAVTLAGGAPVMLPIEPDMDYLRRIYDRLDALLLSGGGDIAPGSFGSREISPYLSKVDPQRDAVEFQLVRWAVKDDKPLLAICRGHQVLNTALGGTLYQDIRHEVAGALRHDHTSEKWFYQTVHEVAITDGSTLHHALGTNGLRTAVNSLHHQALNRVADDLQVVATADDGIIESVEVPGARYMVGVQWHPEALVDNYPQMRGLFTTLVSKASMSDA